MSHTAQRSNIRKLPLAAIGVVYGDIGTSPLYTTTLLACYVAIYNWDWPKPLVKGIGCLLLAIDLPFFCSNAVKIVDGGWLPLGVGTFTFAVMAIWKWEHFQLLRQISRLRMSLEQFNKLVAHEKPVTISGTAVYLAHTDQGVPHALIHNLRHNHVLHERIIFMTFRTQDIPYVDREKHIEIRMLAPNVLRMAVTYGFHETPDIDQLCLYASEQGVEINLASTTFFFSRETLTPEKRGLLSRLRAGLFIFLRKNALRPHDVIHITAGRVIEMGMQLQI
jgi:KUP system potassium uptake protein